MIKQLFRTAVVSTLMLATAHAEPPPGSDGKYHEYFSSLQSDYTQNCCNDSDCRSVNSRYVDHHWEAFIDNATFPDQGAPLFGQWYAVENTMMNKSPPMANRPQRATACFHNGHVLCFDPPSPEA